MWAVTALPRVPEGGLVAPACWRAATLPPKEKRAAATHITQPSKRICAGCSFVRERRRRKATKREESMTQKRRDLLLVVSLATAAATPAFGQASPPTLSV